MPVRRFLWGLLGVLIAGASMAAMTSDADAHDITQHGVLIDEGDIVGDVDDDYVPPDPRTLGGSWDLLDQNGNLVTDETYRGKWMLIFFGFAACREACPGALLTMTRALEVLGDDADAIQPLFIDFTMEEPDLLGLTQFVSHFHPNLIGLTGDRRQTFAAVRKFKVRREFAMMNYSEKETGPRINHTTYFYIIDPEGLTRGYFSDALPAEEHAAEIRYHMDRYAAEGH